MQETNKRSKNDLKIYFAPNLNEPYHGASTKHVIFCPSNDGWNDFGFRVRFDFRAFERNRPVMEGQLLLGFLENAQETYYKIVRSESAIPEQDLPQFFTMLGEMADYREFVSQYGQAESKFFLVAIYDLVALRTFASPPAWYSRAIESDIFSIAFMRESSRHYAFNNADSVLRGTERLDLGRMSNSLTLKYSLDAFETPINLNFKFEHKSIIPKRINILIGKNGLGKSQALRVIVESLQQDSDSLRDTEGGRPQISRLLAIATPGETQNTFPPELSDSHVQYRRLKLQRSSRSEVTKGFGDLCIQLIRSDENIAGLDRWTIFLDSISFLEEFDSLAFRIKRMPSVKHGFAKSVKGSSYIRLVDFKRGGEQALLEAWSSVSHNAEPKVIVGDKAIPLSSGKIAFLKFALQACLFIENGTLVLLDEPETHLHPEYVSHFIRVLDNLLSQTGSNAIVATHSPYFVREVTSSQVHVFKSPTKGVVEILKPRLATFGADIGSISYFVFDDDIVNSLVEKLIENLPDAPNEQKTIIESLQKELSNEVSMYLRRRLKFEDDSEED